MSPTGHTAIALAMLTTISAGSHILLPESVFEPTANFCSRVLRKFSIEIEYYDAIVGKGIEQLIKLNTNIIFMESPGSHTMEIQDIPAIVKIAKTHGIKTILNNTRATPLLKFFLKPIPLVSTYQWKQEQGMWEVTLIL